MGTIRLRALAGSTLRRRHSEPRQGLSVAGPRASAKNLAMLWTSQWCLAKERSRFFVADAPTKKTLVGALCQRKGAKTIETQRLFEILCALRSFASWRSFSVSPDRFSSCLSSALRRGGTQNDEKCVVAPHVSMGKRRQCLRYPPPAKMRSTSYYWAVKRNIVGNVLRRQEQALHLCVILSRGGRGSALLNPASEAKNLAITLDKPMVFGKRALRFFVADAPQND